jgi:hypothetical protein
VTIAPDGSKPRLLSLSVVVALATALHAPILRAGFVSDDYVLLAAAEGHSPLGNTPFNLWAFHDGIPEHTRELVRQGGLPWWTEPTARHAFWRPLSSGILTLAHGLLQHRAIGYHALSLLVCAINVLLAGLIYRRFLPRSAAVVALVFFAAHPLHIWPIHWLSAIHIPVASAFGLLALVANMRYRDDGWARGRAVSLAALALSLLAGEAGLCFIPYLVAAELLAQGFKVGVVRSLAPHLALTLVYLAVYRGAGFGAHGIDGYLDPAEGIGLFAGELGKRVIAHCPELLTAGIDDVFTGGSAVAIAWGVVVAFALAVALTALFQPASRRALAVWTVAALLAALPACLGPTDRALLGATFGAAAVFGWAVASCGEVAKRPVVHGVTIRVVAAVAAVVLFACRGVISAAVTFDAARASKATSAAQRRGIAALPLASPSATDVVVLLADDQTTGLWGDVVHAFKSGKHARSWQALSLTSGPHHLTRVDERTFDLETGAPGGFSPHIYRNTEQHPLRVGQRFETPGSSIEVTAVALGRATRIRVRADRSLDDASWCFATRSEGYLARVVMPPVGGGGVLM